MKYGSLTLGQVEALVNNLGGQQVLDDINAGKVTSFTIRNEEMFFDKRGRCSGHLVRPELWLDPTSESGFRAYTSRTEFKYDFFQGVANLATAFPHVSWLVFREAEARVQRLTDALKYDMRLVNAQRGFILPICLPQLQSGASYAQHVNLLLPEAAQLSIETWQAESGSGASMINKLQVVDAHYKRLVERLRRGPLAALMLFDAFFGYSLEACDVIARDLPPQFVQCGPLDYLCAFHMYPKVFAAATEVPGITPAATLGRGFCGFRPNVKPQKIDFFSAKGKSKAPLKPLLFVNY